MREGGVLDCPVPAQAVEAKEGVEIQNETITLASISYQNFFRSYPVRPCPSKETRPLRSKGLPACSSQHVPRGCTAWHALVTDVSVFALMCCRNWRA
jgi:hypothetical protein